MPWNTKDFAPSIWHKMYVNSLRTVQSAYSRLFDGSMIWWSDSKDMMIQNITNMMILLWCVDDGKWYISTQTHRAAHMSSTFSTISFLSTVLLLLLLLAMSRSFNIFFTNAILAHPILLLLLISLSMNLLLAAGSWQDQTRSQTNYDLWRSMLAIQLDILWRKIPKNIIFSWQRRSDKTSFSDQLWSLMLNVGNIQLDDVKKETKEHKSQLTKKEDQTRFLSQTNYILFSDCQNWPYN